MKSISKTLPFFAAFMLVAMFATSAHAQVVAATGKVVDKDGKPATGVVIFIDRQDIQGMHYETKTDKYGEYFYNGLQTGRYKYSVMVEGKPVMVIDKQLQYANQQTNGALNDTSLNEVNFDLRKAPKEGSADQEALAAGMAAANAKNDEANKTGASATDLFNKGAAAFKANQLDQAADLFKQAMDKNPKNDIIAANYARTMFMLKKYPESIAAYSKAIELKPTEANYYINLGTAYSSNGKPTEAVDAFSKAAEVNPAVGGLALNNVGRLYDSTGKAAESAAAYKKSIELDPKFADSYFRLAITKFGDQSTIQEAVPLLTEYLKLEPTGENAEAAKGLLEATRTQGGPTVYVSEAAQKEAEDKAAKDKAAKDKADATKAKNQSKTKQ
jgi:tetratricopeptide (TPR) repeat protein